MPIRVPFGRFDPEYDRTSYSRRDALAFALASELAYVNEPSLQRRRGRVEPQLAAWGFPSTRLLEVTRGHDIDTQGFVAANDTHVLIAFRGSDSGHDWVANLQAVKDPGPLRGSVHEGFQDAFLPALLQIGVAIGRIRTRGQQIWVTGHSLGSAHAVLLVATLLEHHGLPVAGLYTYGAPRVGDTQFAAQFDARMEGVSYRVVTANDMVPHVPPEPFFSHAGSRVVFDPDGQRSHEKSAWTAVRRSIWGWFGGVLGEQPLSLAEAHLLDGTGGYIQHLLDDLDRTEVRSAPGMTG